MTLYRPSSSLLLTALETKPDRGVQYGSAAHDKGKRRSRVTEAIRQWPERDYSPRRPQGDSMPFQSCLIGAVDSSLLQESE